MIIQLDDECRIKGTKYCWQLEIAKTVKGKIEWRPKKYFSTLDAGFRELAWREIRLDPAEGMAEAIEALHRVTEKYRRMLDAVVDEGLWAA